MRTHSVVNLRPMRREAGALSSNTGTPVMIAAGLSFARRRHARNRGEIVLAVGVDLQRVGATGGVRRLEPGQYGDAFAAVHRATDQSEPARFVRRQFVEHRGAARVAAVIDEPAFVAVHLEGRNGLTNRMLVIKERNDQSQPHHP